MMGPTRANKPKWLPSRPVGVDSTAEASTLQPQLQPPRSVHRASCSSIAGLPIPLSAKRAATNIQTHEFLIEYFIDSG
jgi:hypothetical protein